jgi:spore maturation protein CgeB
MRVLMFYHSLLSDWNHGNAHFLRGIATELISRGHEVRVYEPRNSWSLQNLIAEHGIDPVRDFHDRYPGLTSRRYALEGIDLDQVLDGADIVIVHEWNDHDLVARIGEHRSRNSSYRLFFHDTHHRMVTQTDSMARYRLEHYDGVLAYGKVLQDLYACSGMVRAAWTWHEAADTRCFRPVPWEQSEGDLVWVGNWGDDEREKELQEFLFNPIESLGLKSRIYGVRYPQHARAALLDAGIDYAGWLANFDVPQVFARYKMTVHVPRAPYTNALPGIPTIRPFEALACGIPLVCSPWDDVEGLFTPGRDFLLARNGREMTRFLRDLANDPACRLDLASHGLTTIRQRHTCAHRVDELFTIHASLVRVDCGVPAAHLPHPAAVSPAAQFHPNEISRPATELPHRLRLLNQKKIV